MIRSSARPFRLPAVLVIGVLATMSAQTVSPQEKAWFEAFMKWATTVPADVPPARVEPMYRRVLASEGLDEAAIAQRWSAIQKQQRESEAWLRMSTNRSYAHGWYEGRPPSKFLAEFARGKKPGKALDCGTGAGRNAVFLASLGWDVTGVDISDVAVAQANELAARNGVKIKTIRSSFRDFDWGRDRWDLILNIDSWDGIGDRPSTFAAAPLADALKPGGTLYIESHLPPLLSPAKPLLKAFPGLEVLEHTVKPDPDWQGKNQDGILIFVAVKK